MIQRTTVDAAIVGGATATPWWIQFVEPYLEAYVAILVALIVTVRLGLLFREWRRGRKGRSG